MRSKWLRDAAFGLLLLSLPLAAVLLGTAGVKRVELGLGPGDGPYVQGFHPFYEVDGREHTHWTSYDASIELPLVLRGGPVTISYRFARVFAETAQVEVELGGRTIDRFECRGGVFQTRSVELASVQEGPIVVTFRADSHERRNMGIKLDWLRIDYGDRARARLMGWSAAVPLLWLLLVFVLLRAFGWSTLQAALLVTPLNCLLTASLWWHPWMVHRFFAGQLLAALIYGTVAIALGQLLVRGGWVSSDTRRICSTLAFAAFILRALAVSHPDFYYPDLRTHATLIQVLQEAGWDFFRSPATYIEKHGVWVAGAYGKTYAFPYTPGFHLPFMLLPVSYDALLTWMKLVAAAWSTLPLLFVWGIARRFGLSAWGAFLMVVIPTYTSRLSFAFMPSLFGHAVDIAFIWWLTGYVGRLSELRIWAAGVLFVAASQLGYVSGVLNVACLLIVFAGLELARREPARVMRAARVLGMLAAGSVLSFAAFYRGFLDMVFDVLSRAAGGGEAAASRYAIRSFLEVAYERTHDFFQLLYPVLTALGLGSFRGAGVKANVIWAWLISYALLLLGRAKMPDIFTHGHETLFITPLVCLTVGALLGRWLVASGWKRWLAAALTATLTVQGLYFQWQAIAAQLVRTHS